MINSCFAQKHIDAWEEMDSAKKIIGKSFYYMLEAESIIKSKDYKMLPLLSCVKLIDVELNTNRDIDGKPLIFFLESKTSKTIDTFLYSGAWEYAPPSNIALPFKFFFNKSDLSEGWDKATKDAYSQMEIRKGMHEDALRLIMLSVFAKHDETDDIETSEGKSYSYSLKGYRYTVYCNNGKVSDWTKRKE